MHMYYTRILWLKKCFVSQATGVIDPDPESLEVILEHLSDIV